MKIPAEAGTGTSLQARDSARELRVRDCGAGTMLTKVRLALPLVLNWTLPSTSANNV
jgi:hypothetical protein